MVVIIRATILLHHDSLLRRTPVVGIETVYRPVDAGFKCRQRQEILGPTQRPIQWIPCGVGVFFGGKEAVKLSTHFHLVPRLRKSGAVHPLHLYDLMARARKTSTLLRIFTVIKLSQGCAVFVFAVSFSLLRDVVESHRRGVDVIHVRCP